MVVGTRNTPAVAAVDTENVPTDEMLAHVLEAIFGFGDGSPVRRALMEASVESINNLLTLISRNCDILRRMGAANYKAQGPGNGENEENYPFSCRPLPSKRGVTSLEDDIWLSTTRGD